MLIKVKVEADSDKEEVIKNAETSFDMKIKEKAERNLANKRVLEILRLRFPNKRVLLVSGHHSSSKIFSIE